MSASIENKAATLASCTSIPADIETALTLPDWRSKAEWPLGISDANQIAADQARRALGCIKNIDSSFARDAVLLALPNILAYARAIVMTAVSVSRSEDRQIQLAGLAPEYEYIRSGQGSPPARTAPVLAPRPIRLEWLRRIARIRSWSSWLKVPSALLAPTAMAISHNPLLCSSAASPHDAIGFLHAESMLQRAWRGVQGPVSQLSDYMPELSNALMDTVRIGPPFLERARFLVEGLVRSHLSAAARDIQALRSATLPMTIWSGSGGTYAARAVGLEVMQRGGQVVRFDHGTPKGFVEANEINALVEYSVSSEFVLTTSSAAAICRKHSDNTLVDWREAPRVVGAAGDPVFANCPARRSANGRHEKLKVVYAPTQLLGFRQLLPVQQPDVVHLNWQMEVAEALREMPIEMICQPHPEGLFGNRPHPLERIVNTQRGNFDARLGTTDVFIFDYPSTTALWEAACTDARIIFLDVGAGKLTPEVARLFAERATVISVSHDERNRPVLDAGQLRDAVLAEAEPADPSGFRRLLAGEA